MFCSASSLSILSIIHFFILDADHLYKYGFWVALHLCHTDISVIDTELVEAEKCHFINHNLQIPEVPLEPYGEASHKRLRQDHLPILHLPRPHFYTLHVIR